MWNEDVWNAAVVGADTTIGTLGMGRTMAISMKGTTNSRIVVGGWDIPYTEGGIL